MIRKELKLVSQRDCVSGKFPKSGILYHCATADGFELNAAPGGTVLCAFILAGKKILMAEQASGGIPGVGVRTLTKGQTVSIGLTTYTVQLSRKLMRPNKRTIIAVGAICAALVVGASVPKLFAVNQNDQVMVQPMAAKRKAPAKNQNEAGRLDLLLKQDEGHDEVQIDEGIGKTELLSEAASREAFKLYEQGLSLLDSGKYSEAEARLGEAQGAAAKLPIVPPYMRMIDEAIARAKNAIEEKRAAAFAEVRALIDRAKAASPSESLEIIAEARTRLADMPVLTDDDLLKRVQEDLDRLHHSSVSVLLAKAHTLERLEGCRAADEEYREMLRKYGSIDKLLSQEIQSALDRCGGGGGR